MANTDLDRDRFGNQGYGQDWRNTGNYRYGEGPYGNWGPGYSGNTPGYGAGYGYGNAAYSGNYGTYGYPGGMYNPGGWNQGNWGQNQGYGYGYGTQGYGTGYGQQNWNQTGPFSGVGPQNYQRSDTRIQEDINDRLTQHPMLDARNVNVDVHNGDVTLNGWVNTRHDKRMAEDITDSVSGVKNVTNNLSVQPSHQQQPGWMQSVENAFTPGQAGPSNQPGQQRQQNQPTAQRH